MLKWIKGFFGKLNELMSNGTINDAAASSGIAAQMPVQEKAPAKKTTKKAAPKKAAPKKAPAKKPAESTAPKKRGRPKKTA